MNSHEFSCDPKMKILPLPKVSSSQSRNSKLGNYLKSKILRSAKTKTIEPDMKKMGVDRMTSRTKSTDLYRNPKDTTDSKVKAKVKVKVSSDCSNANASANANNITNNITNNPPQYARVVRRSQCVSNTNTYKHQNNLSSSSSYSCRLATPALRRGSESKRRSRAQIAAETAVRYVTENDKWVDKQSLVTYASYASMWTKLAQQMSTPNTDPKTLIKRSALLFITVITLIASVVWGGMYAMMGLHNVALICWTYTMIVAGSLLLIFRSNSYDIFEFTQLFCILFFPSAVQFALGGIRKSGGCSMWGVLSPVGAVMFNSVNYSIGWFYFFIATCLVLSFIDYYHDQSQYAIMEVVFYVMNQLGSSTTIFFAAYTFSSQLEDEFDRSESLLLNILPQTIANRMKHGETQIMDQLDDVTILFADLVGFTKASTQFKPTFLIGQYLRHVFSAFDKLAEKYSLEKIKTIGDAYMIVGGLDQKDDIYHGATEIIMLAFEFMEAVQEINGVYGIDFDVRIG